YEHLRQSNVSAVETFEPTDSYLGKAIREIVLFSRETITENQQILLFQADRAGHVIWIKDQLDRKITVICDRFIHSTLAYQGKDKKTIQFINTTYRLLNGSFLPDITYLLDLDPSVALNRIDEASKDNFETSTFQNLVRNRYLSLAKENPNKFEVLDGTLPPQKLLQIIIASLQKRFNLLDRKER
ncbi:MAG: dTMP kinase, partial [Bacteroidota bacterium]